MSFRFARLRTLTLAIYMGISVVASVPVVADQTKLANILVLPLSSPKLEEAFRRGLNDVGLVEGRNITIDWRHFDVTDTNLSLLPADLEQSKKDIVVALGTQLTRVAMQTKGAPVVFVVGDPVKAGFAASLARPGGNGTGISVVTTDLDAKRMELLKRLAPKARRIALIRNPMSGIAGPNYLDDAARTLGVELIRLNAQNSRELEAALHMLDERKLDGLLVGGDLMLLQNKAKIARAARQARLPAVFPWGDYHDQEVLASYAPSLSDAMRRTGAYVDAILRGAKPGEIPIEQLSKYELTIDLRMARELGIQVSQDLLLQADTVIR